MVTLFPSDFPSQANLGWQIWTRWHSTLAISAPPVKFTAKGDHEQLGTEKKPTLSPTRTAASGRRSACPPSARPTRTKGYVESG